MKRVLAIILVFIIASTLPLTAYATGVSGNIYTINGITVKFAVDSSFTADEQAAIAEWVVNGKEDPSATTYNLWCTMFGHKTTTESFTIIEHCVSATAPRCVESLQDVTACSRCDYVTTDIISSNYIFCCD